MAYVRLRVRPPPVWGEVEGRLKGGNRFGIIATKVYPIRPYHTGQYGLAFSFSLLRGLSL